MDQETRRPTSLFAENGQHHIEAENLHVIDPLASLRLNFHFEDRPIC